MRGVLVVGALLTLIAAGSMAAAGCADDDAVTVSIRYSRFEQETLTVPAGSLVTFTLRNNDPIEHEWIVGTDEVHDRHRTGTEPFHDAVPNEVTIPALTTRETSVMFREPGEYRYICHLPGHEAYGMTGTLTVVES